MSNLDCELRRGFVLQREWPGAAASLREGLSEQFKINRLGLSSKLRLCLGTTNLIDNSHSSVRAGVQRVQHLQTGQMAPRWAAAAFAASSKSFRRIMGRKQLWMLKAALSEHAQDRQLAQETEAS